jgi:hypothetical protein
MYISIVLYVLIVFSLHRESLKLILAMNPSPRAFQSLLLRSLWIYISYGTIGYYLVVYTVLYLGDHLCSGTQCGDCTNPSDAFSL